MIELPIDIHEDIIKLGEEEGLDVVDLKEELYEMVQNKEDIRSSWNKLYKKYKSPKSTDNEKIIKVLNEITDELKKMNEYLDHMVHLQEYKEM